MSVASELKNRVPRLSADTAFATIDLAARPVLEPAFRGAGYPLCEFSFALQVCWQQFIRSAWTTIDDWTFVRFLEEGAERFLCPVGVGDPAPAVLACFRHLRERGHAPVVRFVPDPVASRLDRTVFDVMPDPDNDDYLYAVTDLAEMRGRRYSGKRNHIAQFLRGGDWSFDPYHPGDRPAVNAFLEAWCHDRDCRKHPALDHEMEALDVCLDHGGELGIFTFLLRGARGEILGLTAGGPLLPDTWAVHFEKGLSTRPGIYPMLTRQFALSVPPGVRWLDREQDMGVENLRHAKKSLHPSHRERAWTVRPA
jgi:hypothetical protein